MKLILLIAQSLDGKVARTPTDQCDWTGKEDKKHFRDVTKKAGVVIMGRKTFDTIGKHLPGRLNIVMTQTNPTPHIVDNLWLTDWLPCDIKSWLNWSGYETVCLIGGPTINTLFARAGLIDEIHVTIVPKIFGEGMSMFTEPIDMDLAFQTRELFEDGGQVLKYKVVK